jgi:hypothetical protein
MLVCVVLASGCSMSGLSGGLSLAGGIKGGGGGDDDDKPKQPPQPTGPTVTWYRLSLATGQYVDGQIVGGDAASWHVQTMQGYFAIERRNVIAMTALVAPQPRSPYEAPVPAQLPPPNVR